MSTPPGKTPQLVRILELLKASTTLTTGNVASALGVDVKTTREYLEELWTTQKIGRLRPRGRLPMDPGKQEMWHLLAPGVKALPRDSQPISDPKPPSPASPDVSKPAKDALLLLLGGAKEGKLRSKELSRAVGFKPREGGALIASLKSAGYFKEEKARVCDCCGRKVPPGMIGLTPKGNELLELMSSANNTT